MSLNVISKRPNPLAGREEYLISIEHHNKSTPSREAFKEEAAKLLSADRELLVVENIHTEAGKNSSRVKVFVYSKKEMMPKPRVKKDKKAQPEQKKEAK